MYRNQNQNRRNNQGGNFNNNNNNYGGSISRGGGNVNPWNNIDNGPNQGNRGGGGGGGGNQNDAMSFLQNLFRGGNQGNMNNMGNIPSLFENMANGFNRGGGGGGGGNGPQFNRGGGGSGRNMNHMNMNMNMNNRRNNNRIVKGAIRKPNPPNRPKTKKNSNNSKPNDSGNEPNNSTNNKNIDASRPVKEAGEDATAGKDAKRKISPYADVPNDMFYCHLCAKHMWDSTSFENHLKGRTHQMMKDGVEESYHMKANMLRQEAKIAEQLKSIEIDRLKRLGKQIRAANQVREYCAMCDLHFYGHLSTHRKSDGHLELKKFLHPKCDDCSTEFHNRAEYDVHLLSPQHMKTCKTPPSYKSDESRRNRLQILTEADELQGLREEKPKKDKKEEGKEGEGAEGEEKKEGESMETETAEGNDDEAKGEEPVEEDPEIEPILDFKEGDEIGPEIENKIPKYNCKRQVGFSLISQLTCYECHICNKYFDNDKTAEIHSRTFNHHRMFVKFLNEKANEIKIAQKRAAAALAEESERQKRIKLDDEAKPEESGEKSELYDPSEATGDDDATNEEEITDEAMNDVVNNTVEEKPVEEEKKVEEPVKVEEPPKVEEKPAETSQAPAPAPVAQPSPQQQPQQQQQQNKQFGNRGGRGGRGNRRGGRYGGNRF